MASNSVQSRVILETWELEVAIMETTGSSLGAEKRPMAMWPYQMPFLIDKPSDPTFPLFSLPVEIQVDVMTCLPHSDLRNLITSSSHALRVFNRHWVKFLETQFRQFPETTDTMEVRHLVYRIVEANVFERVFFRQTRDSQTRWLDQFSYRSDEQPLPTIAKTVRSLEVISATFDNVDFWMRRFLFEHCKIYQSKRRLTREQHILREATLRFDLSVTNSRSFSPVESYRMRRALLLYQLYCTLFHFAGNEYIDDRHHIEGELAFLERLQPFLLTELTAVWCMLEWAVMQDAGIRFTEITRLSHPFNPLRERRVGDKDLAWFLSRGLGRLRDFVMPRSPLEVSARRMLDADELQPCRRSEYCRLSGPVSPYISAFLLAALIGMADSGRASAGGAGTPTRYPLTMQQWRRAPPGTNQGSWTFRVSRAGEDGSEHYADLLALAELDQCNWRGLAFWEKARFDKHMSYKGRKAELLVSMFAGELSWRPMADYPEEPVQLFVI